MEFSIVNKTVALLGKRNSGKSQLLRYIVKQTKNQLSKVFVISPTEIVNNFYKGLVDDKCIFDKWNENWVEELITKMTEVSSKTKNQNVLLILDDVCSDTNFNTSNTFKKIFTRGRHIFISIIITCQYMHQLPRITRSNLDYILAGQMNAMSTQILADEFLYGSIERKQFVKMFNTSTRDYGFLLINCNSVKNGDDLNSIYGVLKCPAHEII
jgi:hypothetical protein